MKRGRAWASAAAAALVSLSVAAAAEAGFGPVSVFARMPPPGYPASAVLAGDGLLYAGTFKPLSGGSPGGASKVFGFDSVGQVRRSFTVQGQDPSAVDGVQVATRDRQGRLVLLDQAPARVLLLDPRTGTQRTWATIPTLSGATAPEPDFAAWGPDGSLYVTDYAQFVVWRIPPGGGVAQVWLNDPALNGVVVGPAGIQLMADGHTLLLSTGAGPSPNNAADLGTGKLYRIAIRPDGSPGPLQQIWESGPGDAPDGLAIARSGNVYLALVGPGANALVEVSPTGQTLARLPATALSPSPGPIPFDSPGSVTFDGERIIVGNQAAISGNTDHMALLSVDVGELGLLPSLPPVPQAAPPALPSLSITATPAHAPSGRRVKLRFKLAAAGRPVRGGIISLGPRRVARTNRFGVATVILRFTTPGRRTFTVRARGQRSARAVITVTRPQSSPT